MSQKLRVGRLRWFFILLVAGLWSAAPFAVADSYRLGITMQEKPGEGVEVATVMPGGPATNLYRPGDTTSSITLTPGDVITAVNGKPVHSIDEYLQAMNAATPGKVRLTVRDSSNGQVVELATPGALGEAAGGAAAIQAQANPNGMGGANGAAKLYLVKVTDTNAKGGAKNEVIQGLKIDEDNVLQLFRDNVPGDRLHITRLNGDDVSKENVLAAIRGLVADGFVAGRDILVVYYDGHGEYNLRAADHVMNSTGGKIYFRTDVALTAKEIHPRSTLIISDACAAEVMGELTVGSPPPGEGPKAVTPIFESLFFDPPPGVTAISSTMKGQYAGCNSVHGSYFTTLLCGYIERHSTQRPQWKDVLDEVNKMMLNVHPDSHQVAYIVGDAGGADPPPRLGAVAQGTELGKQFHGCEVTRVVEGYPAQLMHKSGDSTNTYSLTVNRDVIQKINGDTVEDYAEFINACRNSPTKMKLTVYDTQTGQTTEFEATLRNDR